MRKLEELIPLAKEREIKKLAVACGEDPHTIEAVAMSVNKGIIKATLVGNKDKVDNVAKSCGIDPSIFEIIHEPDPDMALKTAVKLVRDGDCHFLMKGLIDSAKYMRAILNREEGLLPPGKIISHVTLTEFPNHSKLLIVSDVAVIPKPDLTQKIAMTNYCIEVAHKLGIEQPKVAIIAAVEKVNPKMEETIHAAVISKMAERGQIKGAIVDGPLAFDVAVSKESCKIKGLDSKVGGDADILIFPNIETGNVFFKTCAKLAGGEIAALVVGTKAPCILTSRADSESSKFYSIVLGALVA